MSLLYFKMGDTEREDGAMWPGKFLKGSSTPRTPSVLETQVNDQTYLGQKVERNRQADFRSFSSLVKVGGKRKRNLGYTCEQHKIHEARSHLSEGAAPSTPTSSKTLRFFFPGGKVHPAK